MDGKVKFLVVDDHPIFRHGVTALVESESGYRVCAEAGTAAEALEAFERDKPDFVLLDISLGDKNGLDLLRSFWASNPSVKTLVISIHDQAVYAERALRAHARGYLMKQEASSVLKEAIRTILDGRIYVSPSFREQMLKSVSSTPKESFRDKASVLSDRELEVLEHTGHGFSASEIAARMGISVKTVGVYQDHIKKKLSLESIPALRKYAIEWVQGA